MKSFIFLDHVSFAYQENKNPTSFILNNICLMIHEGEFVALIGRNGSGKSTLARLLNGLIIPDQGRVLIEGLDTRESANHPAVRRSIGMVFQRPQDQIVATTVSEDIAFGPGNLGLPANEICRRVNDAMEATGLKGYNERPSHLLSAGETQRVALAGVLAMRPKCIIFDETTAMLDPSGRDMVMKQAKELNNQGITILFITHLMEEAAQASRVLVLDQGQIVMDDSPAEIFSSTSRVRTFGLDFPPVTLAADKIRKYFPSIPKDIFNLSDLLRNLTEYPGIKKGQQLIRSEQRSHSLCIDVDNLSHIYLRGTPLAHQSLDQCNLRVAEASVNGLIGATGSGKSTLLQHLNGLITPQAGKATVLGCSLNDPQLDVKSLRKSVGLAFQQPEDQIFEQYVGDEIAFSARNFAIQGKISEIVQSAMETVGLDFIAFKDRLTSTLSGGERRKVALASVLAGQPQVLLLDEPLAGLDPISRNEITTHLSELNKNGKTIIFSTHQFEEAIDIMDEISIMARGKDLCHGTPGNIFSDTSIIELSGIKVPMITLIIRQLRDLHWPISIETMTIAALESSLTSILNSV